METTIGRVLSLLMYVVAAATTALAYALTALGLVLTLVLLLLSLYFYRSPLMRASSHEPSDDAGIK